MCNLSWPETTSCYVSYGQPIKYVHSGPPSRLHCGIKYPITFPFPFNCRRFAFPFKIYSHFWYIIMSEKLNRHLSQFSHMHFDIYSPCIKNWLVDNWYGLGLECDIRNIFLTPSVPPSHAHNVHSDWGVSFRNEIWSKTLANKIGYSPYTVTVTCLNFGWLTNKRWFCSCAWI
jgi:hypothetical protein